MEVPAPRQRAAQEARLVRVLQDQLLVHRPRDGTEHTVGVPEQGGPGAISQDPLPPGSVYTAAADDEGKVGPLPPRGHASPPAPAKCEHRPAWTRAEGVAEPSVRATCSRSRTLGARRPCSPRRTSSPRPSTSPAAGVEARLRRRLLRRHHVGASGAAVSKPGTVVLGDLTIQGNLKGSASITEPLQVALENGALRVLVPIANKSQFAGAAGGGRGEARRRSSTATSTAPW